MKEGHRPLVGFLLLLILSFTFPRIVYAQPTAATRQEAAEKGGSGYACRCVAFRLAAIEGRIQWLHSEKMDVVTLGSFASASRVVPEFQSAMPVVAALAIASAIALYGVSGSRNSKTTDWK